MFNNGYVTYHTRSGILESQLAQTHAPLQVALPKRMASRLYCVSVRKCDDITHWMYEATCVDADIVCVKRLQCVKTLTRML